MAYKKYGSFIVLMVMIVIYKIDKEMRNLKDKNVCRNK